MDKQASERPGNAVPPEIYYSIFQSSVDGQKILSELSTMFHDRALPVADPNAALYQEGARSVVMFIIQKCQAGQK